MTTINLKDYYPWYLTNEYIEVSDEVAAELRAGKLAEAAHAERVRYNKSYYSLDCDDGIEYSACVHEPSPQELLEPHECRGYEKARVKGSTFCRALFAFAIAG